MVLFIFTLILMFSLSAVLYLMVRALPRIAEDPSPAFNADGTPSSGRKGFLDRWAHSEIPEKIDASFNSWLLKFLRKFKVFVLKLDNTISGHLNKIHKEKAQKESSIDFKEINEAKKDENGGGKI